MDNKYVERKKYALYIMLRKFKWYIKGVIDKRQKIKYEQIKKSSPAIMHYGKSNPSEWMYVARKFSEVEGHGSMTITMLGHCALAEKLGMKPVIDMQNYYSRIWQRESKKGKENAWEYFYEQPCGYSLSDAYQSKNVLLSDGLNAYFYPSYRRTFDSEQEIVYWNRIYKTYIKLNPKTEKRVQELHSEIPFSKHSLLAVSVRRGIEWGHKIGNPGFAWHVDVPDLTDIIEKTKELKYQWNCDGILLVIDDVEGVEEFTDSFPNEVYYLSRNRLRYFTNGIPNPDAETFFIRDDIYETEVKYLAELLAISKCSCFIGTKSTTSLLSMIVKGKIFENMYLFDD